MEEATAQAHTYQQQRAQENWDCVFTVFVCVCVVLVDEIGRAHV